MPITRTTQVRISHICLHEYYTHFGLVWPILDERSGGWNKTGLFLAVLALYECYTRPQLKSAVPSEKNGRVETAAVPPKSINTPKEPWLPIGLALGSLLFTLHQLLADSSTLIAWSWTGYPITGPVPNLHGAITLVAQTIGLLIPLGLGTFFGMITQDKGTLTRVDAPSTLLGHPAWFSFGAASAYTLYAYEDWTSYAGGLAFAVFLMSITPSVLHRAAIGAQPGSIHKVFFTAWLTVSVLDFVSVMTVAYAFVSSVAWCLYAIVLTRWTTRYLVLKSSVNAPTCAQAFIAALIPKRLQLF